MIKKNEETIIDANVSQLSKGEGASGNKLPTYANPDYEAAKKAEGLTEQAGSHYNILLTGNTREKAFIDEKSNNNFIISSRDEKNDKLMAMTDDDIWGLQNKNLDNISNDKFIPLTIKKILERLGI